MHLLRSSSDTTTSTTSSSEPLSPFSSCSLPSETTSDELPDLGAFNTVLREFTYLQPTPRALNPAFSTHHVGYTNSTSSGTSYNRSYSDLESGSDVSGSRGQTVWNQRPIASYLSLGTSSATATELEREYDNNPSSSTNTRRHYTTTSRYSHSRESSGEPVFLSDPDSSQVVTPLDRDFRNLGRNDYDSSQTEGEMDPPESIEIDILSELDFTDAHGYEQQKVERILQEDGCDLDDIVDQPSLGYLDEALSFIAAERQRWNEQRSAASLNSPIDADGDFKQGVEIRRKRRRKRTKTPRGQSTTRSISSSVPTTSIISSSVISAATNSFEDEADADDSSSSSDRRFDLSSSSGKQAAKSTPSTPARRKQKERGRVQRRTGGTLKLSKSTPQLRLLMENPTPSVNMDNPRTKMMIDLSQKLAKIFPEDQGTLAKIDFSILPPTDKPILGQFPSLGEGKEFFPRDPALLGGFVDTRGPSPCNNGKLIHVFVDHSNILIGLLTYLKRYPHRHPQYRSSGSATSPTSATSTPPQNPKPPKHLSHSALSLILERGRPVARRVMVTSSPLYQPMESAQQLGFEVRVFARVPDLGDGMDRERDREPHSRGNRPAAGHSRSISSGSLRLSSGVGSHGSSSGSGVGGDFPSLRNPKWKQGSTSNLNSSPRKVHRRRVSGSTSTESELGAGATNANNSGFPTAFARSLGSPQISAAVSASLPSTSPLTSIVGTAAPTHSLSAGVNPPSMSSSRVRYREQGVDELLQLKLHQALASIDGSPPAGSTIILATGDGNVGQFNEDGFLGGVRTALKKGWMVELYAWEGGLSKAWRREFGEGSEWAANRGAAGPKFKVVHLEQFGSELVEMYY